MQAMEKCEVIQPAPTYVYLSGKVHYLVQIGL